MICKVTRVYSSQNVEYHTLVSCITYRKCGWKILQIRVKKKTLIISQPISSNFPYHLLLGEPFSDRLASFSSKCPAISTYELKFQSWRVKKKDKNRRHLTFKTRLNVKMEDYWREGQCGHSNYLCTWVNNCFSLNVFFLCRIFMFLRKKSTKMVATCHVTVYKQPARGKLTPSPDMVTG